VRCVTRTGLTAFLGIQSAGVCRQAGASEPGYVPDAVCTNTSFSALSLFRLHVPSHSVYATLKMGLALLFGISTRGPANSELNKRELAIH
jgi:hypothetical protein